MGNGGNHFRWPVSLSGAGVFGRNGKRGLVLFGAYAFRMFAALCLFLTIGIASVEKAHADDGKESLAPKIVQEMQCGSHRVVIPCGKPTQDEKDKSYDSSRCYNNPLKVFDANGRSKVVLEFGGPSSSAEAMVCGVGRRGRHYMEVLSQDCAGGACDNNYYLLGEDGSYIASKDVQPEEPPLADAQDYDQFVAQNKIHFRHHPVAPVALMQCGSHEVVITCGKRRAGERPDPGDLRECVHNVLKFIRKDRGVRTFYRRGDDLAGFAPESMLCAQGSGGRFYVQVRYEGGPGGADEFYVMFTESGKWVAERPAMRDHESRAAKRYDRIIEQRGLETGF